MKLNPDLIHRTITGEHILIPVGETAQPFNGVFTMSPVAGRIWDLLGQEKDTEELMAILLEEYDVDEATLKADVDEFIALLKKNDLLR